MIVLQTLLSTFLISCAKKEEHIAPAATDLVKKEEPAPPSLCDSLKVHFAGTPIDFKDTARTEHIERKFQRVLRHDCTGNLQSDMIETVQSPHLNLNLKNLSQKPFKAVFVFNESTCANILSSMPVANFPLLGLLSAVTGDGIKKISLKGDLASATFTFRLATGSNKLIVRYFHDCMPSKIDGHNILTVGVPDCESSKNFTTVGYPLEIAYSEETLDGSKTVDPTPETCAESNNN